MSRAKRDLALDFMEATYGPREESEETLWQARYDTVGTFLAYLDALVAVGLPSPPAGPADPTEPALDSSQIHEPYSEDKPFRKQGGGT